MGAFKADRGKRRFVLERFPFERIVRTMRIRSKSKCWSKLLSKKSINFFGACSKLGQNERLRFPTLCGPTSGGFLMGRSTSIGFTVPPGSGRMKLKANAAIGELIQSRPTVFGS